jgi:hypothetical protein
VLIAETDPPETDVPEADPPETDVPETDAEADVPLKIFEMMLVRYPFVYSSHPAMKKIAMIPNMQQLERMISRSPMIQQNLIISARGSRRRRYQGHITQRPPLFQENTRDTSDNIAVLQNGAILGVSYAGQSAHARRCTKLLVENGASVIIKNRIGETALSLIYYERTTLVKMLKKKAQLNSSREDVIFLCIIACTDDLKVHSNRDTQMFDSSKLFSFH